MLKYLKIYLTLFILTFILCASDYNTLILLEFENTNQNKEYDDLKHKLPNLIKESVLLNNDIDIDYAGKIEPYLGIENSEYKNALLLLGKFSIDKLKVEVSLDLYDLSTWNKVSRDFYFCHLSDKACFENELMNYSTNLLPLYFSNKNIEDEIVLSSTDSSRVINDLPTDNLFFAIDNFAVEAELSYSWDKISENGAQYGDRYYKDINKEDQKNIVANSREKNTEKLISYFNKVILNPYDVEIQNINMEYDDVNNNYIDLIVPVTYEIKKNLIEDMLTTLPHLSTSHSIGNLVIKFFDSDFIISNSHTDKYGFMKYQVIPVLFLSDNKGKINYIYIDDYSSTSLNDFNSEVFTSSSSRFYPLFAITPGKDNIQINLDMTSLNIEYNFRVSVDEISKYSKVAIKFLHQKEIESIIDKLQDVSDDN